MPPLRRIFFLAVLAAAASGVPCFGLDNVVNLDAEYELDRLMGRFPDEGEALFLSTPTAFRATGTSLNIRHFYVQENLKVRFPLWEDRFAFRARHDKLQGLEREDQGLELEFEARAWRAFYLSLLGDYARHKADTVAGFAGTWGRREGRRLRAAYLWPGFDTNKAFRNQSVNEGFEKFYRRFPQEARLEGVWIGEAWSFHARARRTRPWAEEFRSFRAPAESFMRAGREAEARAWVRRSGKVWALVLEGETWAKREAVSFTPSRPAEDRDARWARSLGRACLTRRLGERKSLSAGYAYSAARARERFPLDPGRNNGYGALDRIVTIHYGHPVTRRLSAEAGYHYDRHWVMTFQGTPAAGENRSENRGVVGGRYDFTPRAGLRVLGTLELDKNQSETFVSFDGGTVQFQAAF